MFGLAGETSKTQRQRFGLWLWIRHSRDCCQETGRKKVVGVDIDGQAIISSEFNAEQNHVAAEFYLATHYPEEQVDIVVANILSSALSVLAPALARACKQHGRIALSGILREQTEQVSGIYAEWFDMNPPEFMDSWVLLTGTKK